MTARILGENVPKMTNDLVSLAQLVDCRQILDHWTVLRMVGLNIQVTKPELDKVDTMVVLKTDP